MEILPQIAADRGFEVLIDLHTSFIIEGEDLHQNHAGNFALWIDPEVRIVDARPTITPRRTEVRVSIVGHRDLKAEAKFVATSTDGEGLGCSRYHGRLSYDHNLADLILDHLLHGRFAKNPPAIPFAVVEQHLKELDVIRGRGIQSAVTDDRR